MLDYRGRRRRFQYVTTGSTIAYLDMGWEDIKVAAEYDGEQHRTDRYQYNWDLRVRPR